ncbi:hypothetical protein [Acetobacter oeni]|nr:hypothetical protein [Acetobacter oeni]MBB3883507.1 hypothetical protein [Acetobacter oeni]NHO19547.1 hypothetical protein [Acetobacter oeni]
MRTISTDASQMSSPGKSDAFVIRLGPHIFPLCIRGKPIRTLYPGWHITALHVTLLPMAVARLCHENGTEAYWIFDANLNYRASLFEDLTESERNEMVDSLSPFFHSLTQRSLKAVKQTPSEAASQIKNLSARLRDAMITTWLARFRPPRCITSVALSGMSLVPPSDAPSSDLPALAPLLPSAQGLSEQTSPVILFPYGSSVLCGHHVLKDNDLHLTRFADPVSGTVLYVGTGRTSSRDPIPKPVIYSPGTDTIVTDLPASQAQQIPGRILSRFMDDPNHVSAAPDHLLMDFGATGSFTLGAASSLATSPPPLPGNWLPDSTTGKLSLSDAQITDAFGPAFSSERISKNHTRAADAAAFESYHDKVL